MLDQQGQTLSPEVKIAPDIRQAPHDAPEVVQAEQEPAVWPIFLVLAGLLLGWAVCVVLWGLPGLYLPAVAVVPVIFLALIIISRG